MKKILSLTLLLGLATPFWAQTLISSTLLGTKTQSQLTAQFNLPFIQFGAKYYKVTYTTLNLAGQPDTVSGLIVAPDNPLRIFPRLVYQHGTSGSTQDVPSVNILTGGEGDIGLLFAGLGYFTLMPDYLGLGVSDDVFHPYVHAASEASVAVDLLRASETFASQHDVHTNEQLFVTGYSQGGHAAMALHRTLELDLSDEFTVTAAAPLSGPYSIGDVMRGLILSNDVYYYPAYIPNTALSYQTVYGNIFNQLTDLFKPAYAGAIQQFYAGNTSLSTLNTQLIGLLVANEGACIPSKMVQPDVLAAVQNDPQHPINLALRDNDVYHWAPEAPVRLFYCMADDQVPFENSLLARDTMLARGAADLAIQDVEPTADHGDCVVPALTNTLVFFLGYQQIGTLVDAKEPAVRPLSLSPNPAANYFALDNPDENAALRVVSADGRVTLARLLPAGAQQIDVRGWTEGVYSVQLYTRGSVRAAKLVVRR